VGETADPQRETGLHEAADACPSPALHGRSRPWRRKREFSPLASERRATNASAESRRAVRIALVLLVLLALALRLYEVLRPGLLLGVPEYDDAVYFGGAIRLIDGSLPYRDFAFIQPPGISLLLAPVALLAKVTGTDVGLAVARVITACAGAASVLLCGLLVRRVGLVVVILACGMLAVHPDASEAAQSVFLEPWLVLFTLLGMLAAFDGGALTTSRRRLAWAGVAFGIACSIKAWGVVPVLAILALLLARRRTGLWPFVAGLGGALAVSIGPFFAAAPRAFFDNVVVAQLARVDAVRTGFTYRLNSLFGFSDLTLSDQQIIAAALSVSVVAVVISLAASRLGHRRLQALEWFTLICLVLSFAMFVWPVDYYFHYAAFFAPFLAIGLALAVGRLVGWWGSALHARGVSLRLVTGLGTALVLCLAVAVGEAASVLRQHEAGLRGQGPPVAEARVIPPNACILTDYPAYTIAIDRFESSVPGCSRMVDPLGTDYALSHGENALTGAGSNPAVSSTWLTAFRHAQYVWLSCAPPRARSCDIFTNRRIPWTATILGYFTHHFRRMDSVPAFLYIRTRA
jgi:alpha-1,2-mannosyltransferase